MPLPSVLLGSLQIRPDGITHELYGWHTYGIVCPSLCTSNGSPWVVASTLKTHPIHSSSGVLEHIQSDTVIQLHRRLITAYYNAFPDIYALLVRIYHFAPTPEEQYPLNQTHPPVLFY